MHNNWVTVEQQPHRQAPTTTEKENQHTQDRQAQQHEDFLKFANSCRKRSKIYRFRFNDSGRWYSATHAHVNRARAQIRNHRLTLNQPHKKL